MADKYDEHDLEDIMRAGLAERAEHAELALAEPFTGRRRRRAGVWLGAAAAAAVVALGVPVAVNQFDGSSAPRVTTDPGTVPGDWRVESYAGVQVRVPPSWGWGGAPTLAGLPGGRALDCGMAAFVVPGSLDYENAPAGTPYVGRPVMMTDACSMVDLEHLPVPSAPYVWLDAEVPVGTVELGDGYVMETVRVGVHEVSVATQDAGLRSQILGTAQEVAVDANGCRTRLAGPPVVDSVLIEGMGEVSQTSVCAYGRTAKGQIELRYSRRIAGGPGPLDEGATVSCDGREESEWVVLVKSGTDSEGSVPATQDSVVHPDCGGVDYGGSSFFAMTPAFVDPWVDGGVKAYVVGSGVPDDVRPYFRGVMG